MKGIDHDLEARVVADLERGDIDAAATHALRGYGPQVLGYLTAILRDEARAEDAFSIFSENLWSGLASFRRQSSVRTWAYKVAYHAATRILRDPQRKRGVPLPTSKANAIAVEVRTATAAHLRTENKDAVQKLRDELSEEEQTLLVLRVDRNLEWREIADVMDVDEPALRKRFERVKARLRKLAQERSLA